MLHFVLVYHEVGKGEPGSGEQRDFTTFVFPLELVFSVFSGYL